MQLRYSRGSYFCKKPLFVQKFQLCRASPIYKHLHHKHAKWTQWISYVYISFSWHLFKFFLPPDLLTEQASFLKTKTSFGSKISSFIKLKQNNKKLSCPQLKSGLKVSWKHIFLHGAPHTDALVSKGCLELFSSLSDCVAFALHFEERPD